MIAIAGGGAQALSWMLGAGASATVAEVIVPYSRSSFDAFVGRKETHSVSFDAISAMSDSALAHCKKRVAQDILSGVSFRRIVEVAYQFRLSL